MTPDPFSVSSPRLPRVCVIGAGAIGGFFGARLAQGHAQLSAVARGRTLQALQSNGWVLLHRGQRTAAPVRAVADTAVASLGEQDLVLITVKAYALAEVAPLVAPLLGPDTVVLPVLNGVPWWLPTDGSRLASVDPEGVIAAAIPRGRIVGAVAYPACHCPEPGVAHHVSGSRLVFGEIDAGAGTAGTGRVARLVTWLRAAGFDAEASQDLRSEVWKKLLGNACFNPVSLLTGSATDRLIDDADIHRLFVALMRETLAVGRALGCDLAIEPEARIAQTRLLGHVKTSMLQDAEAGKAVEIDAILGAVIELARGLGVPTPINDIVHALARVRARLHQPAAPARG